MKTQKTEQREAKQLSRLNKTRAKGMYGGYFFVLVCLIAVVNILDEVTSNLTVTVQSSFVTEFFVNNPFLGKYYTFQEGLALHSTVGVVTYAFGIITPFYKALADKWGRKPLFVLSIPTLVFSITDVSSFPLTLQWYLPHKTDGQRRKAGMALSLILCSNSCTHSGLDSNLPRLQQTVELSASVHLHCR